MHRVGKAGSQKRKVEHAGNAAHNRSKGSSSGRARRVLFASEHAPVEVESLYAHRPVTSHQSPVTRKNAPARVKKTLKIKGVHPYVRTMFLSLGAGTALLLASTLYYVRVSAATAPFLEGQMVTKESAAAVVVTTSTDVGLETADASDVGVPIKPFPRAYLRTKAKEKGFDPDLLERIAHCESSWRMVKNQKSTAVGFFQILDGTERLTPQYKNGLSKEDPYVNIDMALALYEKYGTIPWYESRDCWEK